MNSSTRADVVMIDIEAEVQAAPTLWLVQLDLASLHASKARFVFHSRRHRSRRSCHRHGAVRSLRAWTQPQRSTAPQLQPCPHPHPLHYRRSSVRASGALASVGVSLYPCRYRCGFQARC